MTYSPVPELNLLKAFQDEYGYESYSQCFGLGDWNDVSGLIAGWSKDDEFVTWLDTHFGLAATDNPDRIVDAAQAEYGERFATWKSAYLS